MNPKKEDTPYRLARRKYEEEHKEKRREVSANFQTMIPRELYEELCAYLQEKHISKVQFIKDAFEKLKRNET